MSKIYGTGKVNELMTKMMNYDYGSEESVDAFYGLVAWFGKYASSAGRDEILGSEGEDCIDRYYQYRAEGF